MIKWNVAKTVEYELRDDKTFLYDKVISENEQKLLNVFLNADVAQAY